MDLNWAPGTGVPAVLDAVDGSPRMLRHARVRLLRRLSDYPTEIGGRALATLAVALTETGTPMSGLTDPPDDSGRHIWSQTAGRRRGVRPPNGPAESPRGADVGHTNPVALGAGSA
jgi:hypothetical protein